MVIKAIQEPTISQNVGFVILSGGSGIGKTRASQEILGILKNLTPQYPIFQNTCSIYFDFKNEDSLQDFENDTDQVAGLRVFSHGLCLSTVNGLPFKFQQKIEELHKLKVFEISNILQLIGEKYHELLGNDEPIPLIIIMDEMQLNIDRFSKIEPKEYKKIAKFVGAYNYNQYGINKRALKDKLIIIPVISGTDKNLNFPLTEFRNYQFPLPPFSGEGIFKILKDLKIDEFWYNNKEKERFWKLIGIIPR